MGYMDLFTRYGAPSREAEINLRRYFTRPDAINDFGNVARNDKAAAEMIATCERIIDDMRQYRQALTARYNQLATMPSRDRMRLERYVNGDGRKIYYIRRFTDYDDGTTVERDYERFTGKERRAALARFDELKKQFPGIVSEMDIEKKSWER